MGLLIIGDKHFRKTVTKYIAITHQIPIEMLPQPEPSDLLVDYMAEVQKMWKRAERKKLRTQIKRKRRCYVNK